jgi:hypothetical protein
MEVVMRHLLRAALIATVASVPAFAQDRPAAAPLFSGTSASDVAGEPYWVKIALIDSRARKWAKQDGGTLTEDHVALLRQRLDKANREEAARW